jgi:hypothetical protein
MQSKVLRLVALLAVALLSARVMVLAQPMSFCGAPTPVPGLNVLRAKLCDPLGSIIIHTNFGIILQRRASGPF